LKDKVERGEQVPMVFGPAVAPTRAGYVAPPASSSIGGATKTRKGTKGMAAAGARGGEGGRGLSRGTLQVAGLVVSLVVLVAFAGYMLWPPSAQYLYRKAAEGMASTSRVDKIHARDEYIAELDRRHPNHPYKKEVQAWRDELELDR